MKKIIFLLCILLLPILVNAKTCDNNKISISSITLDNKSENIIELEEPNTNGKTINLNLSMAEVGDTIKYKVVIKNNSNEDYELNKNSINISSDYIDYSFESDNNSNIIKANSSKIVYLNVQYRQEVPENEYQSGTYTENRKMTVNLSNQDNIINPKTGLSFYILIITIIAVTILTSSKLLKNKKAITFLILLIGIIPITTYALCKYEITINSNIKIEKDNIFCLTGGYLEQGSSVSLEFNKGDTIKSYFTNIILNIGNYSDYSTERDNTTTTGYNLLYKGNKIVGFAPDENTGTIELYQYPNYFEDGEEISFEEPIISSRYGCYYTDWVR